MHDDACEHPCQIMFCDFWCFMILFLGASFFQDIHGYPWCPVSTCQAHAKASHAHASSWGHRTTFDPHLGGPCMKHLEYKKHAQWLTTKKATTTTTLSRSRRRERMITTCKAPILNHQQEDICDYVWRSKPPVLSRPRFSKALWTWRTTW